MQKQKTKRSAHVWAAPPPGAGPSGNLTCRKCGSRMSVVGKDSDCPGKHRDSVEVVKFDYDPHG